MARPATSFRLSAILLGCLAIFLSTSPPVAALEAGDRAPEFALPALSGGGRVGLSEYRGKIVYLDFWASWCAPCLKAVPAIEKIRSEFPADTFQIVAINLDRKKRKALRFLDKHPIGYPSASDPEGRLPELFGVETMPTSYLIDANGVIRYVHRGFKAGDASALRLEIRRLLEAK
jgi:peroxiredoxin